MHTPLTLLNQLTPIQFLAEYWQKKPLLIRQAIPQFTGLLDGNALAGLACEDEVQARIVKLVKGNWQVVQGPFTEKDFARLPKQDWTLLVQGVNHYLPSASALLQQFNFIPYARLDDLMVSYAPQGGGVGPHFDSYDVFLLQGSGKRRWKISHQADKRIIEDAPLRILKQFECHDEWELEAGDMLYLPPRLAHWGIAESDDCMTYSIGFRAPKAMELVQAYIDYMHSQSELEPDTLYADADLTASTTPAEISGTMVDKVHTMLTQLPWQKSQLGACLASYLSEPKPHIVFQPNPKLTYPQFVQKAVNQGIRLDHKSQLLYWQSQYFLNGEAVEFDGMIKAKEGLALLANQRLLQPQQMHKNASINRWLYDNYLVGYCQF